MIERLYTLKDAKRQLFFILVLSLFISAFVAMTLIQAKAGSALPESTSGIQIIEQSKAASLLDELENTYVTAAQKSNISSVGFVANIPVYPGYVAGGTVMTKEQAVKYILSKAAELQNIAISASGTAVPLLPLNKSAQNSELFGLGQAIDDTAIKCMVSVRTVTKEVSTAAVKGGVAYQNDSSQYKNYKKTVTKGKDGVKEVTAQIVSINGTQQDRQVVSEKVIVKPQDAVVVVGTKELPKKQASGSFRLPIYSAINSPFGMRWGRLHTGIDLAASVGTKVAAADGGTVIFAGWENGYGNLIKIDHGNGFVTYYAHNSKLYVHAGQKVAKGDIISASGNTGNTTGPHLHFEIRKNGTPVNPRNYL